MAILTNHLNLSLVSHKTIVPQKKDKNNDRKLTTWATAGWLVLSATGQQRSLDRFPTLRYSGIRGWVDLTGVSESGSMGLPSWAQCAELAERQRPSMLV